MRPVTRLLDYAYAYGLYAFRRRQTLSGGFPFGSLYSPTDVYRRLDVGNNAGYAAARLLSSPGALHEGFRDRRGIGRWKRDEPPWHRVVVYFTRKTSAAKSNDGRVCVCVCREVTPDVGAIVSRGTFQTWTFYLLP